MTNFKPNDNMFYYLYFIQERMNIFWNRLNEEPTTTEDEVFINNKFTNVYRVLDRSSQYLVKNIINHPKALDNEYSTQDLFWRILLYKHFNLPSTWEYLESCLGEITTDTKIKDIVYALEALANEGTAIYSNAYMLTCPFMRKESFLREYGIPQGSPKFAIYLRIYQKDLFESNIMYDVLKAKTFEQAFNEIKKVLGIADFLAYQYIQDFNYSRLFDFDDNEFCAAGPGTERGVQRVFDISGTPDYNKIVKWITTNYSDLVDTYSKRLNIDLGAKLLPGWDMKVPDFSNCFCETDKLMRQMGVKSDGIKEGRMKQKFKPSSSPITKFEFPAKWNVESLIKVG